jgi:predicted hydrocarbon binding protein
MHGMIFGELKKYVEARLDASAWTTLQREAGIGAKLYLAVESYPDDEMVQLVVTASRITGKSADVLLEDFGEFITPDLLKLYGGLVKPGTRTLEFLEQVEGTIHRVVRTRSPNATPAHIRAVRSSATELVVHYGSKRKLCALARGLVRGIAQHYGDDIRIEEPECMHTGAAACRLVVRLQAGVPSSRTGKS